MKTNKYITNDTGTYAKLVSPFTYPLSPSAIATADTWLPLTIKQDANCVIEGSEVWQYEPQDEDFLQWYSCSKTYYDAINRGNSKRISLYQTPTRIAITPIEQPKEEVKQGDKNIAIDLAKNKGHVYLSFHSDDATTNISTPYGSLVLNEVDAVKMANLILNNYYGI